MLITRLTVEEFEARKTELVCRVCRQRRLTDQHITTNNARQVVCQCGCRDPLGRIIYLKQTKRQTRREYPETLDEVWAKYGDVCIVCSSPKSFIDAIGQRRERHHVMPYANHEHAGPLVPMCGWCHTNATERQRLMGFWRNRIAAYDKSSSDRRTGVPPNGATPNPMPATPKNPHRQLEGFPDRAANE